MKAKELIEHLSKVDPELEVVIGLPSWGVFTNLLEQPYNKIVYQNNLTSNYIEDPSEVMSEIRVYTKKEVVVI